MLDHLLSLRFTAEESVLLGAAIFAIACAVAALLSRLFALPTPTVEKAAPRTIIEFPPRPTAWLRDIEHAEDRR